MSNKNFFKLENLTKYYFINKEKKYLFKNINLDLPLNKNIGILGKNGAGKTSFLRILGGIEFPNQGKIISNKKFSWTLALSGGFQGSLSGYDNAKFICRIHGIKEKNLKNILEEIQKFSELNEFFYIPVKKYSSGMKARLGFAISIFFDFDYYLIDETLSVGDIAFKKKCEKAINDLLEKRNFVIVSHDLNIIRKMCDVVLIIDNENIILYEDIEKAISVYSNL